MSLRLRFHRAQDRIILTEDEVLYRKVLVTLIAGNGVVRGRFLFNGWLIVEAEIGPRTGLVLESIGVLYRDFQTIEVAHKVTLPAGLLFIADTGKLLNHDGAVPILSRFLVLRETFRVDVARMEFGKQCCSTVELIWSD